jgi:cytochrome c biogenesis factor
MTSARWTNGSQHCARQRAEPLRRGTPPTLSVNVTEKPLLQLVWIGLYVVLADGAIAVFQRLRQAMN